VLNWCSTLRQRTNIALSCKSIGTSVCFRPLRTKRRTPRRLATSTAAVVAPQTLSQERMINIKKRLHRTLSYSAISDNERCNALHITQPEPCGKPPCKYRLLRPSSTNAPTPRHAAAQRQPITSDSVTCNNSASRHKTRIASNAACTYCLDVYNHQMFI
jgi:sugar (pentulose or hexulose) kinase